MKESLWNSIENKDRSYFIIDTHGSNKDKEIYDDVDFYKYIWSKARFNKVKKDDFFIYRRPSKKSKFKEFYFFGVGAFGTIEDKNPLDEKNKEVYSLLHDTVKFEKIILASNEQLKAYKWEFKNKSKKNWEHFFNQYGMTEIKESDFLFLLNMGTQNGYIAEENEEYRAEEKTISHELESKSIDIEGKKIEYFGYRYERKPELRKEALRIHGYSCNVCDFNFEEKYGAIGREFIEVHHIKPLSFFKEEAIVNPETDLIPVCSNCHRMIHRKKDHTLSIEELKKYMDNI